MPDSGSARIKSIARRIRRTTAQSAEALL